MTVDARFAHERMLDRGAARAQPSLWSETSSRGMVVTAHYLATRAGVQMLEAGGNAVDAAVAAALALGVCESAGSGLGGMAMLLVYDAPRERVRGLPGACRAPALATPEVVSRSSRYRGHSAVAVPTQLAVLRTALTRYGRLSQREVIAPAIVLAEEGLPLTPLQSRLIGQYAGALRRGPLARLFLDEAGAPYAPGSLFRQLALAATLKRLARDGFEDFYQGAIAREISADMEAHGGFVRAADLAAAAEPREREPILGGFGDDQVATLGPPAGGLTLLQMLHLLDATPAVPRPSDPTWSVLLARIIRCARRDRQRYRLRTGAEDPGEAAELLDRQHARSVARRLARGLGGPGETSHVCTMDAAGNAVSLTQSIERSFGAGAASDALGFLYNGYLRAFKVQNRRHPHYLVPGAPARSNAAPTLCLHQGRVRVVLGSTGSERMNSGILQVLARLAHQSPFEASHAPRLHCTPEGVVLLEAERFSEAARSALVAAGLRLEPLEAYSFKMGGLQLIVSDDTGLVGVTEPRRDGAAAGPRESAPANEPTP